MSDRYDWNCVKKFQSPMARGRPPKKARAIHNISGLRNQSTHSYVFSESISQHTPPQSQAPSPDGNESDLEDDLDLLIHFKTNLANEEVHTDDGEELEDEELDEWEGFSNVYIAEAMVDIFQADDPSDLDWLTEKLKNKREKRKQEKQGKYSL